ncbi:glycosyltransferase family 4 protein [Zooshikella sp. RANM57]|uniref:glycosyltransferase family 4 protein n=1 Tax=Zooshikella sp. RANM57 TaxID=3425863 RepID=UPI003D700750
MKASKINNNDKSLGKALLHIISSSGYYGAEHVLVQYCRWLTEYHHYILCLCSDHKTLDLLVQEMETENTSVYGVVGHKLSLLTLVKYSRQLLINKNITAINCHGYKELWVALFVSYKLSIPIIMIQHGFTRRSVKMLCYQWLNIQCCRFKKVYKVICVANEIADIYLAGGVHSDKITIIPNSVDIMNKALCENIAENVIDSESYYMFAFVGRLSVEKGPDLFLKVYHCFLQCYPQDTPVNAVIIGDGPFQQKLVKVIEQNDKWQVKWVGYQSEIKHWLQRINILLITSRNEGTPLCALEAMAIGVPVIAFSVGGLVDLIEHEQTGLLIPPNDINCFADAMHRLLHEDKLREKIIQNAQAKVRLLNSQSRERLNTCYQQLI